VACPYFEPTKLSVDAKTLRPLRNFWSGMCHAEPAQPFEQSDQNVLSECCNMGYARNKCSRFPEVSGPDAVRFTVVRDAGRMVVVSFAVEKNHLPYAQGLLEYSRVEQSFVVSHPNRLIEHQARAYLAGYLRVKPQSASTPHGR
jgi:hypothetical protein